MDLAVGEGRLLHFDGPVESVFIADPATADVRVVAPDVVYVYGKRGGTTNLIAESKDQRVRASMQLRIVTNQQPPNDAMHRLQPTTMTEITMLGDRAAITGKTRRIEEAVDAQNTSETYSPPYQPPINNTTIEGSQQVNIRVRFAEVSRTELQSLGFNWKIFGGAEASTVGMLGGRVDIEVLIEAMRRSGVLNILAEPNLTAVSGQTANFLAGGEIPIPVAQPGGTMEVSYKQFGVSLDFTPTIIATNRIALHVRPEVSTVAQMGDMKVGNFSMPSFMVRRADTTVEVASGETFAIAGLFQRQMTQELNKLPMIGDVPVLGALFTSEQFRRNETELVILITPYLVKPSQGRRMATPLDRPPPPAVAPVRTASEPPRSSGLIMK
jgi:pilus assembly protein CpaC